MALSQSVRIWLLTLAALVLLMVTIGGATRLTGSGLSITEWKPVTGSIPPLSDQVWHDEFLKYQQIPQYQLLNKGMTLSEFKTIYAWEWGHRFFGRLIGLAFFIPFLWFYIKGLVRGRLALVLLGIGCLGGLQGAIGWIMVASGLKPGMVAVAPIKLMLHLTTASVIFALLMWLAVKPWQQNVSKSLKRHSQILLGMVFLQIALGALVAGSKAGWSFNTWPLMDGALIPDRTTLFAVSPWIENFVDNIALVQFNHRIMAYLVVGFAFWTLWRASQLAPHSSVFHVSLGLALLCTAQTVLGIVTLILAVPLWAGLAHQILAFLVLGLAVIGLKMHQTTET